MQSARSDRQRLLSRLSACYGYPELRSGAARRVMSPTIWLLCHSHLVPTMSVASHMQRS